MTLSAGVAWIADTSRIPIERALEEADAAVQSAKLEGRDRVAVSRIEP
jgi:PleD family two-component response regulator